MTAPYNLFSAEFEKFGIFVDEKQMQAKTREVLAELKVETVQSLKRPISEMSEASNKALLLGGPSPGKRDSHPG